MLSKNGSCVGETIKDIRPIEILPVINKVVEKGLDYLSTLTCQAYSKLGDTRQASLREGPLLTIP